MSKRLFAALSVITLALTGCAADDEDEAAGVVEQSTGSEATTEHVVEDDGENDVASDANKEDLHGNGQGDAKGDAESQDSPARPTEGESEPSELHDDTGADGADETTDLEDPADKFGEEIISDRGNLVKTIGQPAGLADEYGNNESIVDFKVTAIEPNFQCTSSIAEPPANGNYIAITFDIQTYPALAEASWPEWHMSAYDMRIISDDGLTENDSVGNGYLCLSEAESLPTTLGPGERAIGKIVLDSAHESGILVVSLSGGVNAWEWEF
ncbi:MAG: hypothetical protein ACTHWJ_02010 [Flaviflexus sp.]|uniref:hypothetical protein n=1 Tax=Flaviflexus sp. TaxID=1969482 RepID=UPI003F902DE0